MKTGTNAPARWHWARRIVSILAVMLVVAVNFDAARPARYADVVWSKGNAHAVGPEDVTVFVPDPSFKDEILVPVQQTGSSGDRDTGRRVWVNVRNRYDARILNTYEAGRMLVPAQATLWIVAVAVGLEMLLLSLQRMQSWRQGRREATPE